MRLWSVHPRYLDAKGLTAVWREALLAQAVLAGQTRGYRQHPQLLRFRQQEAPLAAIARYLQGVHAEAQERGYRFDGSKFAQAAAPAAIAVGEGQLAYEWAHLLAKLAQRQPDLHARWQAETGLPQPHPLFVVTAGGVAEWERP